MSDSCREHLPLLYEDLSDDERLNTHFQKRFHPMVFRGRARNNAKGAAAILRLWPEHWSSIVSYWWIGLGMIAVITFVIYNSIATLAISPSETFKSARARLFSNNMKELVDDSRLNVFMHLFVETNRVIDLDNYLPYINIIAVKYPDFNYNLIVVTDDTTIERTNLSAEENNEIALNLLWNKNSKKRNGNVTITHTTLSKYMESSPLKNNWRSLPKQYIEFLTRAVAVWDKGGIAFNPIILTPRSPHSIYIEKLQNIFENYRDTSKKTSDKVNSYATPRNKVNNIRDIINALEQTDLENPQQNLVEAESSDHFYIINNKLKSQLNTTKQINETSHQQKIVNSNKLLPAADITNYDSSLSRTNNKDINNTFDTNDAITFGISPKFLDFLFQNKRITGSEKKTNKENEMKVTRKRKHIITSHSDIKSKSHNSHLDKDLIEDFQPIVIATKIVENGSQEGEINNKDKINSDNQFTIDLKGNIIASVIPCHAFLGTIFGHVQHQNHESITDFIINEVTSFCKGVLSYCNGIDVILL